MKFLTIIILATLSFTSFSSMKCDLNVIVDEYEGGKIEYKIISSTHEDSEISKKEAEVKCKNANAVECKFLYTEFENSEFFQDTYTTAYEGKIIRGAKKLSDEQIARKQQRLVCSKLNECINNALNDDNSTETFMNKLKLAKESQNCGQVESFIFNN